MSKSVTLGKHKVDVIGNFKLEVKKPPKKFRMTNITSFIPYGKTINDKVGFRHPKNGSPQDALVFDKLVNSFYPDRNENDAHNVRALIQHPKVQIGGISDDDWNKLVNAGLKAPKSEFILTNMDKQNIESFQNEAKLIEARGVLLSTMNPMTIEKLKWLCTAFRLGYRDITSDSERYRVELIKKLDSWIQDGSARFKDKTNLERFIEAIQNMKRTEAVYYIHKLEEMQIITQIGGIYKVGETPVGASINDLIDWYAKNHQVFAEHKKLVIEQVRSTIA